MNNNNLKNEVIELLQPSLDKVLELEDKTEVEELITLIEVTLHESENQANQAVDYLKNEVQNYFSEHIKKATERFSQPGRLGWVQTPEGKYFPTLILFRKYLLINLSALSSLNFPARPMTIS